MSMATIRTALTASVAAVAAVGPVTDYEPMATREEDFKTFFLDATLGYIQGWSITREKTDEARVDLADARAEHLFVIRGYRAIASHGATEKAFQDLIELVRTKLRTDAGTLLGGLAKRVGMPQVRTVEPRTFGSFLCHYCEITVACIEEFSTA